MTDKNADARENIKVVVRCRPMNEKEISRNSKNIIKMDKPTGQVIVTVPKDKESKLPTRLFTFDAVFDQDSTQDEVYVETAKGIVEAVLEGFHGTVFCYGQTGAGKTYTMEGLESPKEQHGLIPHTFHHIFDTIKTASMNREFLVQASFLEIYNEQVYDLLGKNPKQKLDIHENPKKGVFVKGLTSYVVKSVAEISHVMKVGKKNRTVAETLMNATSSRSHSIFMITVEQGQKYENDDKLHIRQGRLNMVDLAGSERQSKTGATGQRLREGCEINKSLSTLGSVIKSLVNGAKHIPYRDSKLTRLLQESLGGNTKTLMVANISPADYNFDETMSTLRYADRAKHIKNKPIINEDPKDAKLREYQKQIEELKRQLQEREKASGSVVQVGVSEEKLKQMMEETNKEKEKIMRQLQQKTEEEQKQLLEQKRKLEEDQRRIAEELQQHKLALEREQQEKKKILEQLNSLQAQVVHGGVNLIEANKNQENRLKQQQRALELRRQRELELQKKLKEQENLKLIVEKKYSSLQEENEEKTKALKKLWNEYQTKLTEIEDLTQEFEREREDYLFTLRNLEKKLKLKQLIMDHFIPPIEVIRVQKRAIFREDIDDWEIRNVYLAGNNVTSQRPQSTKGIRANEYARIANHYDYDNPMQWNGHHPMESYADYLNSYGHDKQPFYFTYDEVKKKRPHSSKRRPQSRRKSEDYDDMY